MSLRKSARWAILLFLFIAPLAWADGNGLFAINPNDVSLTFLSQIFGKVGNVVSSSGGQILGQMFAVYNNAAIALGGIIMIYILLFSIHTTAMDGQLLGKTFTAHIPTRAALGFSLLIPTSSGYSLIQIFVMWVVVQGVWAADTVWNAAMTYIGNGGLLAPTVTIQSTGNVGTQALTNQLTFASKVLKSQVCMYVLQNQLLPNNPNLAFSASINSATNQAFFPGNPGYQGACGIYDWSNFGSTTMLSAGYSAMLLVNSDLDASARIIANTAVVSTAEANTIALTMWNAAQDYVGAMTPAILQTNSTLQSQTVFTSQAQQDGWVMAGSYYYDMAQLASAQIKANNPSSTNVPNDSNVPPNSSLGGFSSSVVTQVNNLASTIDNTYTKSALAYMTNYVKQTNSAIGNLGTITTNNTNAVLQSFLYVLTLGLSSATQTWQNAFQQNADPIAAVLAFGSSLLYQVEQTWLYAAIVLFLIGLAGSLVPAINPFATAILTLVGYIAPFLAAMLSILFMAGAVMAYYVPLIPFILFCFAALGWLAGVIEAMVAAPLVALGIVHPEGHAAWGKAEPAVMLLANVFLRPALIIIGLLAGMGLSFVALKLINLGFTHVVINIYGGTDPTTNATVQPWVATAQNSSLLGWIAMVVVYTIFVVSAIQKCFSMIHDVPDKVFRWLQGGGGVLGSGKGGEEMIKGAVSAGGRAAGGAMSNSITHSAAPQQQINDKQNEKDDDTDAKAKQDQDSKTDADGSSSPDDGSGGDGSGDGGTGGSSTGSDSSSTGSSSTGSSGDRSSLGDGASGADAPTVSGSGGIGTAGSSGSMGDSGSPSSGSLPGGGGDSGVPGGGSGLSDAGGGAGLGGAGGLGGSGMPGAAGSGGGVGGGGGGAGAAGGVSGEA